MRVTGSVTLTYVCDDSEEYDIIRKKIVDDPDYSIRSESRSRLELVTDRSISDAYRVTE